jgi:hypothetical protein
MKKFSDKDLMRFSFLIAFFFGLGMTRFGILDYNSGSSITSTSYSSMLFIDLTFFIVGWISVYIFMSNFATSGFKKT